MKHKNSGHSLTLSNHEIDAIICALPLVVEIGADSAMQDEINAAFCASAAEKLLNRDSSLQDNEIRVVHSAISIAIDLLSGKCSEVFVDIDAKLKSDLSKHFFILNKLDAMFQGFFDSK